MTPELVAYHLRNMNPPATQPLDYTLVLTVDGIRVSYWSERLGPQPDWAAIAADPGYQVWLAEHTPGTPATLARETVALASQRSPIPLSVLALGEYLRRAFAAQRTLDARREARALATIAAVRRIEAHLGLSPATVPDEAGIEVPPETSQEKGIQEWAQIAAALAQPPMGYVGEDG